MKAVSGAPSVQESSPPFGALAPSPAQEKVRRLARRLPDNYWGRRGASLLLGPAGGRAGRAFDVEIFDTARARLHPYDNICEKRVYLTPQLWDARERGALAEFIAEEEGPFAFVDIGANAGLYSLFAACEARAAHRAIRLIAVEPAAEMRARMAFNFSVSGVDATIFPYAATGAAGAVRLRIDPQSRGLSRLDEDGEAVEGRTIYMMLAEAGLGAVDAMKIDIEGHEYPALSAFFRDAPHALWPRLLLLETSQEDPTHSAKALALSKGYRARIETKLNTVLERG
ncbi:MAG: FkbM family methyltransferase [Amphiplicatus sp.]